LPQHSIEETSASGAIVVDSKSPGETSMFKASIGRLVLNVLHGLVMIGSPMSADDNTPVPSAIAPLFVPPADHAHDLGSFRSPLLFDDGSPVRNADDWRRRRAEILKYWHDVMGPWPELIDPPRIETLAEEQRGDVTQRHVRLEIAPERFTEDAYLLTPHGDGPFPAVVVVYYDGKTGVGLGKEGRDFAWQLANRGFVALSLGLDPGASYPSADEPQLQPLSYHAYVAANCFNLLAHQSNVDPKRIGITGHSYGGKWAMFASCLYEPFACAAWSDGGIVFDEARSNVNYWEPWYLGHDPDVTRKPGIPNDQNPRTGAYKRLMEEKRDLHELHALMAPRPFLVSGGAEDRPQRWKALNHAVAVNRLLGFENRVAMSNRAGHDPTDESNAQLYAFFEHFLQPTPPEEAK
jgi:hypothetical protein